MSDIARIAHMSAARGYGVAVSLATLCISARLLGPEGRGTFGAALAWAALFATLANLSLGQALQHRLQVADTKPSLAEQLGTLGGLGLLLSALAIAVAGGLFFLTSGDLFKGISPSLLGLAFAAVPLLVWEQYASNILAASARTDILNRSQYWGRSIGLGLFLVFLMEMGWGVAGALGSQLLAQLLVAALTVVPLWRIAGRRVAWASREIRPMVRSGGVIHLTTVSAFALDQVSILVINNYLGAQEVGFYQLAQQMVGLLLIVPQSALMVIYGGLAKTSPDAFWPEHRRLATKLLGGMLAASLLAYLAAPSLVVLVAGEKFTPSAAMFRALLPSVLGLSLALLMTPQWIGRGLLRLNMVLTLATSLVVVAFSFWAIARFGVEGAIYVRLAVFALWVPLMQGLFWLWCNRVAKISATG
ncbi:lipopolysaccharide biosynthesis protein [Accumulibacter sp.]|jgi:antigen flippase|uniref:Polysaccharide biosynthesis protein n=1 Tax=Accumulibacter regalis TaxID=522306 RepID=C7RNQ1_ACCRE|nr:lipopolysaccharide biosynthesis protein [Accumulibacter sp.]MBN8498370.1 lipopolysaccharide biosynthesis protein [Accumulibacter sp.]MBO3714188.1 lipopolysaccharide biosynthesis protein [Accumulibacter sp.]